MKYDCNISLTPVPVAARSKACCDRGLESHRGMDACCKLSGRGLCDESITRPEESYQLWRVVVCDKETS
jgi:hypothetical protein